MRKVLFIVNPTSAGGRTLERWKLVMPKLEATNFDYDVKFTEGPDCASTFAKETALTRSYDTLVSVGGDGTANAVVNGLMRSGVSYDALPTFTIFPSGTGSDSVRTLGIPKDLEGFLRMLETNEANPIDVGEARFVTETMNGTRYFLNACDVGLGATVAHTVNQANQNESKKSGKGKYFRGVMEQVFKFKPFDVAYMASGEQHEIKKTVIVAVCNGMFFGGGIKISPVSKMNDGLLELFSTNHVSKPALLHLVSKVYSGSHIDHPKVKFGRSEKFEIKLEVPQLLETDGEICGAVTEVSFKIVPHAIKMLH